ncbi:MAG: glycosyl transferase family protein [Candidatus Gottesmanbacteria bacterium GW2011_GWA2_43_14]|uniref:Glycosyl transferase family protein n=1 Tax=Candidatus Gottesmanbacteria bacterium GW2011_GWA2_43_14 TaxID=1618443 RepID=A0A0G1GIS3_9BACT|nr:MAG: glycosyl transferase family protein [Candidatus Gottesmanbacteria bacterium GW2011_GWA2_43_14]
MKISVIIPNFNGRKLLEKNLPQVLKELIDAEVIIVDDASTDGSADFLSKNYPQIKVISRKQNMGFASSVNLGVKSAQGELLLLLNSDVYPRKNLLGPLLPYFNDPSVFAVGMLQESQEKEGTVGRGRATGGFKRGFLLHRRGGTDKKDTLWVSGGAGLYRRNIWQKLGGLDEKYDPFYWEDVDLSWRAVKAGYRIFFEPRSRVVHRQGEGAIRSFFTPDKIKMIAYRNQFYFVWKNLNQGGYLARHAVWLPYYFLKALFSGDRSFFYGFYEAIKLYRK